MDARGTLEKFEQTHRTWGMRIDGLGDEAFLRPSRDGGWGVGQICRHIQLVSELMLESAAKCAAGDGRDMGFQLQPALIIGFGSLPPVRVKVPQLPPELQHIGKPEPIDAADARNALEAVAVQMRGMRDAIASAPPRCRREHPAGGWLNALQWYCMNEMHYRHHLRQLARIRSITSA